MSEDQTDSAKPVDPAHASRPHAPPTDDEAVYYAGSPLLGGKPEQVIGLTLLGALLIIAPIIIRVVGHAWPPGWAAIVLVVAGLILLLVPILITKSVRYRISNYRIDFERGVVSKNINTLELWHVEDLSFHQSLLDRLIGIGTIRVMSHDDTMPNLTMRGLPNARHLFEQLKQRVIAVKRQTGVLKLDTGT
jgi:membrane protein YdbS with pleckstrin-like domain